MGGKITWLDLDQVGRIDRDITGLIAFPSDGQEVTLVDRVDELKAVDSLLESTAAPRLKLDVEGPSLLT
jgi:hypothetical protein